MWGRAGTAPLPGVCISVPKCGKINLLLKATPHPPCPAPAACPGWLQMDGMGAGEEQAEELGIRGSFTPL